MSTASRIFLTALRSHRLRLKAQAQRVTFSPNGELIAIACSSFGSRRNENKVAIWNRESWRSVKTFKGCSEGVDDLKFSTDGAWLACVGSSRRRFCGGEISFWSSDDWKIVSSIEGDELLSLRSVAFSPDDAVLLTGSALTGTGIKLATWNTQTDEQVAEFGELRDFVTWIDFAPDGKTFVVSVAGSRSIAVFQRSGKQLWSNRVHAHATDMEAKFSPNGRLIASCGDQAVWRSA